jgi:hypothetical protein
MLIGIGIKVGWPPANSYMSPIYRMHTQLRAQFHSRPVIKLSNINDKLKIICYVTKWTPGGNDGAPILVTALFCPQPRQDLLARRLREKPWTGHAFPCHDYEFPRITDRLY